MAFLNSIIHAASGGLGISFSITVFYPLETARARLQVDDKRKAQYSYGVIKEIIQDEGVRGLYRGWFPLVVSLFLSNFIYFYIFHGCKKLAGDTATYDLIIGILAGSVTVLCTCPLWMANTRLKFQGAKMKTKEMDKLSKKQYTGLIDCMRGIAKEDGVGKLWQGLTPSLLLVASPALQFMMYELLKRNAAIMLGTAELGIVYFLLGAGSKFFSTLLTYPLQVVQSRLMAGNSKPGAKIGIMTAFKDVIDTHGVRGFYRGFEAKLTQTVLTAALMFLAYEKIASVIFAALSIKRK